MSNKEDSQIIASEKFIGTITKCLSDAVGDDILADINSRRLSTQNSKPTRIWDLINTNMCERFENGFVIANPTKRGAWELVPVFERSTGFVYSLMREQRFAGLKKQPLKRRNKHYLYAFVRSLNRDLIAPHSQVSFFPVDNENDEDYTRSIVHKIITDLGVPNELIKRHALILFSSFNNELSSLRCCMIDSNMNIVTETDWSNYINTGEGVIADRIIDRTSTYVDPASGLKLKQKAKDKKGQKRDTKEKNKDNVHHDAVDDME